MDIIKKFFISPIYIYVFLMLKIYIRKYNLEDVTRKDVLRLSKCWNIDYKGDRTMVSLFMNKEVCFRDIFYWRCNYKCNLLICFFKRYPTLYFGGNMEAEGGAFFLVHPFGTIINAAYVGYGCTFRNNITIGNKLKRGIYHSPILSGNNDFGANCVVIGDVVIGKNACIGAGSVVVKDVPENAIYAGNPAYEIKNKIHNN